MTNTVNNQSQNHNKPLTIGIVAGEVSGDSLGADFMQTMNAIHSNIRWVGVGGTQMTKAGLNSIIDMNRLAVMGLTEVIRHLPDLLKAKQQILTAFYQADIDMFIGIDAPDFNLRLGKVLKPKGIFCVQYVSPSIWAWREGRIHSIKKATDLVLCLFPFELGVYQKHHHPAICVGHPLLQKIKAPFDKTLIKQALQPYDIHDNIINHNPLLCVMAGSRVSEINAILPVLLASIDKLKDIDFKAILPVVSAEHASLVHTLIRTHTPHLADRLLVLHDDGRFVSPNTPNLIPNSKTKIPRKMSEDSTSSTASEFDEGSLFFGKGMSQCCMAVSDITVLASGTATLEAMLLQAPMVVIYKVSPLTYTIAKRLVKIPYVSLPNILAYEQIGTPIVPELIQEAATKENIATAMRAVLADKTAQIQALHRTSQLMREKSSQNPATAVMTAYQNARSK